MSSNTICSHHIIYSKIRNKYIIYTSENKKNETFYCPCGSSLVWDCTGNHTTAIMAGKHICELLLGWLPVQVTSRNGRHLLCPRMPNCRGRAKGKIVLYYSQRSRKTTDYCGEYSGILWILQVRIIVCTVCVNARKKKKESIPGAWSVDFCLVPVSLNKLWRPEIGTGSIHFSCQYDCVDKNVTPGALYTMIYINIYTIKAHRSVVDNLKERTRTKDKSSLNIVAHKWM